VSEPHYHSRPLNATIVMSSYCLMVNELMKRIIIDSSVLLFLITVMTFVITLRLVSNAVQVITVMVNYQCLTTLSRSHQ